MAGRREMFQKLNAEANRERSEQLNSQATSTTTETVVDKILNELSEDSKTPEEGNPSEVPDEVQTTSEVPSPAELSFIPQNTAFAERMKKKKEKTRTIRRTFLFTSEIDAKFQAEAEYYGTSMNDLMNSILKERYGIN